MNNVYTHEISHTAMDPCGARVPQRICEAKTVQFCYWHYRNQIEFNWKLLCGALVHTETVCL